jgi:hypothetical protein
MLHCGGVACNAIKQIINTPKQRYLKVKKKTNYVQGRIYERGGCVSPQVY